MNRPAAPSAPAPSSRGGLALALICIAQLMVVLDSTIATIALPYIGRDLQMGQSSLSWVITAYALTFGGFLLLGGRTGDLFGRRRAFMFGLVLFAVASLVGGFAQSETMLLASRAAQGLGAAFASPNALALITTTFEPGPRRSRAFSVYAIMSGLGAAVGLLLGGWLTGLDPTWFGHSIDGWRFTFLINVPIGVGAAILAPMVLAESELHPGELDIPGAITATAGLLSLVYGITRAGNADYGWGDPWTTATLGAGIGLLALFALIESRVEHPLLPFTILANRDRLASYLVMALVPAAMFTMLFFVTLVFQGPLGYTPMQTGLMFLPFSLTMILWAALGVQRLVQRVNPGILASVGALLGSIALFGMSRMPYSDSGLTVDVNYWTDALPYIILMPLGMSMVFIPMTMSVVHRVRPQESGIASGVLNTMQQVGGALGLATISTIALHVSTNAGHDLIAGLGAAAADPAELTAARDVAFMHGAEVGFRVGSAMLLAGAVIALFFNRIKLADLQNHPLQPADEPARSG